MQNLNNVQKKEIESKFEKPWFKDVYFVYPVNGANFLRPIIKTFEYLHKDLNIVILTNTPGILKDIKVDFNLIVDGLDKYRDEWSIKNEPLINIDDEEEYNNELHRRYLEEGYRFPHAIHRFVLNWAIQNNIKKFFICDCGVKVDAFHNDTAKNGIEILNKNYEKKNLIISNLGAIPNDFFYNELISNSEIYKKYIPKDKEYNQKIFYYDKEIEGWIKSEPYTFGFFVQDINLLKISLNIWVELIKKLYETNEAQLGNTNLPFYNTESAYDNISNFLGRFYDFAFFGHMDIVSHAYGLETEFKTFHLYKMPHLKDKFLPTDSYNEFIRLNFENLNNFYGEYHCRRFIDGFEEEWQKRNS